MTTETKTKTFQYRKARIHPNGECLSKLLKLAIGQRRKARSRRQSLSIAENEREYLLVGDYRIEEKFFFGVLMLYNPGTNPTFLVDDEDAEMLTVQQFVVPETDDGKRRELVESMLFFGVCENHVVVMQSQALRAQQLEMHLEWLLRDAKLIPQDHKVLLASAIRADTAERIKREGVKSLRLDGEITSVEGEGGRTQLHTSAVAAGRADRRIMSVLRDLMKPDQAAQLPFDTDVTGSNLTYSLTLTYDRKTNEQGHRTLDRLSIGLRNIEGVETAIRLTSGDELKGDDLNVRGRVSVQCQGGVPIPFHVYERMRAWLIEKMSLV
jgi:hypothetical protein